MFGASDEVLGIIESGVDFEKRVHSDRADGAGPPSRSSSSSDALTESLKPQIDAEMRDARERLLASVDQNVVQRLRSRRDDLRRVLSDFEKRLHVLARGRVAPTLSSASTTTAAPLFQARRKDLDDGLATRGRDGLALSFGSATARWPTRSSAEQKSAPFQSRRSRSTTMPIAGTVAAGWPTIENLPRSKPAG